MLIKLLLLPLTLFLLIGCQARMTSGYTEQVNCAQSKVTLQLQDLEGSYCAFEHTGRIGLNAIEHYFIISNDYNIAFLQYAETFNNTIIHYRNLKDTIRDLERYQDGGSNLGTIADYTNTDAQYSVVEWQQKNYRSCRAYQTYKTQSFYGQGAKNILLAILCTTKEVDAPWFEKIVDAIHVENLIKGAPLSQTHLETAGERKALQAKEAERHKLVLLDAPTKGRMAFQLTWPGYAEKLVGQMGAANDRKRGRLVLKNSTLNLQCQGQWGHYGPADQPPEHGFWNLACANGQSVNGSFLSDAPSTGTIAGRDNLGRKISGTFSLE